MSLALRIVLLFISLCVLYVVLRRIRKSGLSIEDSIFWIALAFVLIILAVFPQIAYAAASILGFDAPVNFVFLCAILILLMRTFSQDQKICTLQKKIIGLTQHIALREHNRNQ